MTSVELIGGPHDGRRLMLRDLPREILLAPSMRLSISDYKPQPVHKQPQAMTRTDGRYVLWFTTGQEPMYRWTYYEKQIV